MALRDCAQQSCVIREEAQRLCGCEKTSFFSKIKEYLAVLLKYFLLIEIDGLASKSSMDPLIDKIPFHESRDEQIALLFYCKLLVSTADV
jgi:hypothetical protein